MLPVGKRYRVSSSFAGARAGASGQIMLARRAPYGRAIVRASGYGARYGRNRRRQYPARVATLGIEKKFYDTALAATALVAPLDAAGGEFDPSATSMISTPAVGDAEQSRDGKKIIIKSAQVKGTVHLPPGEDVANPTVACQVFVALVLDTQTNGAQLNSEDVFKNLANEAGSAAGPMRNLLFGPRFKILKSEILDLNSQTLAVEATDLFAHAGLRKNFEWYCPMELPVNFNAGTTASVANVIDNSLHVIAYATNVSNAPTISYNARIRFVG